MNFTYTAAEHKAKQVLDECGLNDATEEPLRKIIFGRKLWSVKKDLTNSSLKLTRSN